MSELQNNNTPSGWTNEEWKKVVGVYSLKNDFTDDVTTAQQFVFVIPEDPVSLGLDNFHKLLSTAQGLQDRLTSIIQQVLAMQVAWGNYKRRILEIYNTRRGQYLQEPEIKNLRNEGMQTLACNAKMSEVMAMKQYVEEMLDYVDGVLKIMRQREKNLDATCDKLSRQISVIDYQMRTGEIPTKRSY